MTPINNFADTTFYKKPKKWPPTETYFFQRNQQCLHVNEKMEYKKWYSRFLIETRTRLSPLLFTNRIMRHRFINSNRRILKPRVLEQMSKARGFPLAVYNPGLPKNRFQLPACLYNYSVSFHFGKPVVNQGRTMYVQKHFHQS